MRKIIISSKFNIMTGNRNFTYGRNEHLRKNKEWIDNRVDIFMKYTGKCLMEQTNQDFTAVYVYADETEEDIKSAFSRYPKLNSNIIFVKKSEYEETIDNLSSDVDELFLVRLDSDDLYKKDIVEKLHNIEVDDSIEGLICRKGYMYEGLSNRLAKYYHKNFTFYTLIYRLNNEEVKYSSLDVTPYELLVDFSHGRIDDYNLLELQGRNYIFNIHGTNTDSTFELYDWGFARTEGEIVDEIEKEKILKEFF